MKAQKLTVYACNPTGDGLHRITARSEAKEDNSSVAVTWQTKDQKLIEKLQPGAEVSVTVEFPEDAKSAPEAPKEPK